MKKKKDIRERQDVIFQVSLSISLIITIISFLTIKQFSIKPYLPKETKETILEQVPEEIIKIEEPPPPPKPILPVEVSAGEGEEEEVEIAPTTTFVETQELPVLPETKVYEQYEVEEPPVLIKKVDPVYPEIARQLKIEGMVVVRMIVGPDGKVKHAEIIKSVHEILNEPVLEAVRQWIFRPGKQMGQPVSVRIVQPYRFRLEK
ncbi:MAG: TonB family protein [candidate division WOR-3 bacterium]